MIHVVGDSHIMLFTGRKVPAQLYVPVDYRACPHDKFKEISTYYCVLLRAYHMFPGTTNPQAAAFFDLIEHLPKKDPILVVAGEIDCRGPILNVSYRTSGSIGITTEECVNRYLIGIKHLRDRGWNIIMFSPTPNMYSEKDVSSWLALPDYLTTAEWCSLKEQAVLRFDRLIKASGFPVVSLIDWIFTNSIAHNRKYWGDMIHMNEEI